MFAARHACWTIATDDFEEFTISLGRMPLSLVYADPQTGDLVGPAAFVRIVNLVMAELTKQAYAVWFAGPHSDAYAGEYADLPY